MKLAEPQMRFDIITIFPDFFNGIFGYGVVKRALTNGLIEVGLHDFDRGDLAGADELGEGGCVGIEKLMIHRLPFSTCH